MDAMAIIGEDFSEDNDRLPVVVLGRRLGDAGGWDEPADWVLYFYDFVPNEGLALPSGDLAFCFNSGRIETYDPDNGEVRSSDDMVAAIGHLPMLPPKECE